jgi:hypothetical protein
MLEPLYQTAIQTPWWVYLLLVILLKIGINAAQPAVVPLKKLFIAPVIFGYMTVHTLLANVTLSALTLSIFALALAIGALVGWIQIARQALKFDHTKQLVQVPGTWSVLTVIVVIFASRYYFSFELAVDPKIIANPTFLVAFISITSVCTGLFIGKLLCYLKRMRTDPQTNL